MHTTVIDQYDIDRRQTIENRRKLFENRNLLYWYERLYREQFAGISDFQNKRVLEIGSGTSPIKRFYPQVLTSDVLELDHLDFVFDCHQLDTVTAIPDGSLDVITLTNVLHHLRDPLTFLVKAAAKLKPGGHIIATEPYFSLMSSLIYRYLHHEPVDFAIREPLLARIEGPLASANIALPFLIFKRRIEWLARLGRVYEPHPTCRVFTAVAYMATGGISRKLPIPHFLYRCFFVIDRMLAQAAPDLAASFFTVTLVRSSGHAELPKSHSA